MAARKGTWIAVAAVLVAAACVTATWLLRTHPNDKNPWLHLPSPKDSKVTVSAGDDCGSYVAPTKKDDKIDAAEAKIVVNRGSLTCGEANDAITAAVGGVHQLGVDFLVGGEWTCTGLGSTDATMAGYRVKCQKEETEIRLVPVMDPNVSNAVDNRIHLLPEGAPGTTGAAYSFAPPNRNIWCQVNLDASGSVKDIVCQGELPPNAPLVNGIRPNSLVLELGPRKEGSHFAALDTRIVDFVPPLPLGGTIQVLAVECTATGPDELTCTTNRGTSYEHGFTLSSHGYELR